MSTLGISKIITSQLQRGFTLANSSLRLMDMLQHQHRMVTVTIPYNDGEIKGYRVQHNNILGPYKGGIRIASHVNPELLLSLATWMTIKCSLLNLPLGGGKGGICIDPEDVSPSEMERIIKEYTRGISPVIGGTLDIPAPDINSTSQMMDWMFDSYQETTGVLDKNVVTGKTLEYGGLAGRTAATGIGAYQALHSYLEYTNKFPQGLSFCIQGLGNVGYHLAKKLIENGDRMVGAGDLRGYYTNTDGLSLSSGFNDSDTVSKEDFFQTPCDVMILAASQLQVDKEVSEKLQTSIILEAANGPLDPEADKVCQTRNIAVIPDILVNSGGVQASYYEMLQGEGKCSNGYIGGGVGDIGVGSGGEPWSETIVNHKLTEKMSKVTTNVLERRRSLRQEFNNDHISLRDASYVLALENLETVLKRA